MKNKSKHLEDKAKSIRKNVVEMITLAQSGHLGSSLSCVEIMLALYSEIMRHDPKNPNWENRDRFVLSKGHAAPTLYSVLSEVGYFPNSVLRTLRRIDGDLPGHPDMNRTIGVDCSTGSLGQGISIAVGMALGAKMDKREFNVYVLLGDGELQEGQVWEALMSARHFKLNNLTLIIDRNKFQSEGETEKILCLEPLAEKLKIFGHVVEIDGHDFSQIAEALSFKCDLPKIIIAHTIKGKGVSFMEGNNEWHGRIPSEKEMKRALDELK